METGAQLTATVTDTEPRHPRFPDRCDIRGCPATATWFAVGNGELLRFCTLHRDVIEEGVHPDES